MLRFATLNTSVFSCLDISKNKVSNLHIFLLNQINYTIHSWKPCGAFLTRNIFKNFSTYFIRDSLRIGVLFKTFQEPVDNNPEREGKLAPLYIFLGGGKLNLSQNV